MGASKTASNGIKGKALKLEEKLNSELTKPHKVFGVEFAPINIPLERRKQIIAVIVWTLLFLFTGILGLPISLYVLLCTRYWMFALAYFVWIWVDRNTCNVGSRKLDFFKHWLLWTHYRAYFPINLVKTAELDPKRNYLLASHPHGILSSGTFTSFATEANNVSKLFPGMTFNLVTLPLNFWLPFYRELNLGHGICSAKKESMNYLLSHPEGGRGTVLIPGGAPESLESHPGSYVVQLRNRKGFIKLALQNGSPLVPVYCFGENDIYKQLDNPEGSLVRKFQTKATDWLTFAPPIFTGRGIFQYSFGILPLRHPIFVVVGAPIEVEKVMAPSQDQIDALHSKYMTELEKLFNDHKDKYLQPGAQLKFI